MSEKYEISKIMKWNLKVEDGVRIKECRRKKSYALDKVCTNKTRDAEFVYIVDQDFLEWK